MFRSLIAVALGLTLVLAAMPAMARDVPPPNTQNTCDILRNAIEAAAAQDTDADQTEPLQPARAAWITAGLEDCPGLRESLSADAQDWLADHGL